MTFFFNDTDVETSNSNLRHKIIKQRSSNENSEKKNTIYNEAINDKEFFFLPFPSQSTRISFSLLFSNHEFQKQQLSSKMRRM